ncbi:MAG: 2-oxoacid:acceptor oxidoreductase subunit alpha [Rhodothermales bacterium]|nr:2-oxoacid:acceptor oxidoreductase subunit alpha [Rhodothermales bacterium]MBO6778512.1 2-oxoacid:acceptor oxidoreductase subunit alpha [Rhodothermales bacterium]
MAQKTVESIPEATILFAGDSGDGMQLTGSQFTLATAYAMNDLATLPDFPAEIRAPAGTTYGVSGFQLHFGSVNIRTPGDEVDLLVAMNPAALKVNLDRVRKGGSVLVNTSAFDKRSLDLAGYDANPLEDDSLDGYQLIRVELTKLTREALKDSPLNQKEIDRSKNMFALGLALWLYSRPTEPAERWISQKFAKKPDILAANLHLLKKGYHYGETTEQFVVRFEVDPASLAPGRYRAIQGVHALAMGLVAASVESGLPLFYGSYPITPASDLLHTLSRYKHFGVMTFQAEDEIAAVGATIGAAFGGSLAVTGTSGPGVALKAEAIGLAQITELPMVIVNMQRGGPSTGLPTKTEQSDLLQAMFGRNGDSAMPIVAPSTPGDCFEAAYEAARIAVTYMTPVMLLSDGYLANGSAPWLIPDPDKLPSFKPGFAKETNAEVNGEQVFLPYVRDKETLSRPWAKPGTKGLEHRIGGLEKEDETGNVSYDPANHELMTKIRAEKVERVARDLPPLDVYGEVEGDVLLLGWGSTRGSIEAAVDRLRSAGHFVGSVHLRHVCPFPLDLESVVKRYRHVIVPELNNGQLVRVLRDRYLLPFRSFTKIQGRPFQAGELVSFVESVLAGN